MLTSRVLLGALLLGCSAAGCSSSVRPTVRDIASGPVSCAAAVTAAFPDGRPGTLPAYREVVRLCPSLDEIARRRAFDGSILRVDCAPGDVLALGAQIPQLGRKAPTAPEDLIGTAVCSQFNRECADYDELRRDHAVVARNPTMANRGLYVQDTVRFDACRQRYG